MKITTKFSSGDKVWFHLLDNKYTWGKVESLDITTRCGGIEIINHIKNRHCIERDYMGICSERSWVYDKYLSRKDEQCFKTKQEVIEYIKSIYQGKIDGINELKKIRWFLPI